MTRLELRIYGVNEAAANAPSGRLKQAGTARPGCERIGRHLVIR